MWSIFRLRRKVQYLVIQLSLLKKLCDFISVNPVEQDLVCSSTRTVPIRLIKVTLSLNNVLTNPSDRTQPCES